VNCGRQAGETAFVTASLGENWFAAAATPNFGQARPADPAKDSRCIPGGEDRRRTNRTPIA